MRIINIFFLCVFIFICTEGKAQCNLSYKSLDLSSFESNCTSFLFTSKTSNGIVVNAKCGKYTFTPPLVDIPITTSLDPTEANVKISITPNPFNDYIEINLDNTKDVHYYSLYSLLGNPIIKKKKIVGQRQTRIDLEDLKKGSYVLQIHSKSQNISSHLIIKMK